MQIDEDDVKQRHVREGETQIQHLSNIEGLK